MTFISCQRLVSVLVFPLMLIALSATAQERVISYDSKIEIAEDATMTVTDTIRVRAEGQDIRRGIYRDYPTRYKDQYGNNIVVDFDVISVTRDNSTEPFRSERSGNNLRIYVGSADVFLTPGEYTYQIRYRTNRQISYFEDHDELYWNVTGNGWSFIIQKVQATVTLPGNVPASEIAMEGYTGRRGASGRDYVASVIEGSGSIESTRVLGNQHGLTLVMSWPKGVIAEPDIAQKVTYVLSDNRGVLLALLALFGVFAYLYNRWSKYGRDPEPGLIFPHYNPPRGYSPAASRYVFKMKYDNKAFTAAIVNLAVKGHLSISKNEDVYVLNQLSSNEVLAPGEKVILERLFEKESEVELDAKNRSIITSATASHKTALKRDHLNIYFSRNTGLLLPSIAGSILALALIIASGSMVPVVIIPFVIIVILHVLFAFLLQAPSRKGRMLMDKLEGFKLYLEVAEQDDLNSRHPPDMTPELFERYLPFAIALDVEQAWGEQFASIFSSLELSNEASYQPAWYVGSFQLMYLSRFTSDVSSGFTSALATASMPPPGSSSGMGGGGFSGGGFSGGGGGGW